MSLRRVLKRTVEACISDENSNLLVNRNSVERVTP